MRRGVLRVVSWNVDGLARLLAPDARLADVHAALGAPDVLCLQEIRLRPVDGELVARMAAALPRYVCHFALSDDPKNVTFRGGRMYGVATWVRASLRPRPAVTFPWDREGRVVVTELPSRRVAIVNVYAVNGTDKAYWDHERGAFVGDRHAFKRRFVERVGEEAKALRARGLDLVMIGDWNVSRTRQDTYPRLRTEEPHALARRLFNDVFMPSLDVVDAFRELHPDARKYTWFRRHVPPPRLDAARVDFALVSRSLLPRVVEADVDERPEARGASDHAPLWIAIR